MENASKALIIAGAILLSILIIGLGMIIFNQARDAISDTGMSEQEIQTYNAKFTNYDGSQSGSSVRTLINNVISHNATYMDDSGLQVGITSGEGESIPTGCDSIDVTNGKANGEATVSSDALRTIRSKISAGKKYYVECILNESSGRVQNIDISEYK